VARPGRDLNAAEEVGIVGEEVAQRAGDLLAGLAVEDANFRAATDSRRRDDIGVAVVREVADRDPHAAPELGVEGRERLEDRSRVGVEELDQGGVAGIGTSGDDREGQRPGVGHQPIFEPLHADRPGLAGRPVRVASTEQVVPEAIRPGQPAGEEWRHRGALGVAELGDPGVPERASDERLFITVRATQAKS
jgi:hypothetical protein